MNTNTIDAMVKALAPRMVLPGQPVSRKVMMEYIDILLPIEEKNSAMFRNVTKSIESLRNCITHVASNLVGWDEYTADDAYHIRFRVNCRVIAILIGTRLHKREKDDCYVFDSFFLFNPLPNVAEIIIIDSLYKRWINEIAERFPIDTPSPSRISSIAPPLKDWLADDVENLTNEKLQNTISYALNKNLTFDDLLTIVSMARRLRTHKRKRAALGIAFIAVVAIGGAYLINKNSKNSSESKEDKTNDNSEATNTKTLQDKTSENDLNQEEDDYEEETSIEDIEERLKHRTSIDDLSQEELDYTSDYEYLEDYLKRDDDLYDMTITVFEEIKRREDYGLDDEDLDSGDE